MFIKLLNILTEFLILLVFIHAVGSWFPQLRESRAYALIDSVVEPMLRPIRQVLPTMGGIDLSPMVLIFILILINRAILR